MATYKSTEPVSRSDKPDLPKDVLEMDPQAEIDRGMLPGAVIVSDDKREDGKNREFRLVGPRTIGAYWHELIPRGRAVSGNGTAGAPAAPNAKGK